MLAYLRPAAFRAQGPDALMLAYLPSPVRPVGATPSWPHRVQRWLQRAVAPRARLSVFYSPEPRDAGVGDGGVVRAGGGVRAFDVSRKFAVATQGVLATRFRPRKPRARAARFFCRHLGTRMFVSLKFSTRWDRVQGTEL